MQLFQGKRPALLFINGNICLAAIGLCKRSSEFALVFILSELELISTQRFFLCLTVLKSCNNDLFEVLVSMFVSQISIIQDNLLTCKTTIPREMPSQCFSLFSARLISCQSLLNYKTAFLFSSTTETILTWRMMCSSFADYSPVINLSQGQDSTYRSI